MDRKATGLTMFAALILAGCNALANAETASNAPQNFDNGILHLYKSAIDTTDTCEIRIRTGNYDFTDGSTPCKNDHYSYFRLQEAPSATTVLFTDSPSCAEHPGQNFYAKIKVSKHLATMKNPVALQLLITTPIGTVAPDTYSRVLATHRDGDDQVTGKLSCVSIVRSELP